MSSDYDLTVDAPMAQTSRYATGEAAWALARLHTTFPVGGGLGCGGPHGGRVPRDRTRRRRGGAPQPWPDQWAAYLLAELAPSGLSAEQAAYARRLAERFGLLVRTESQKDGWPTPFVDAHARGAGLGVWVEGVGSLARVAELDPRLADLGPALEERLACGAGLLAARQVSGGPEEEAGAWFREDVTRMDDQQHSLSALLAAVGLIERSR